MNEPTPDMLPPLTLRLVAALFAEEHLLLEWSHDTRHPRLGTAYRALHDRVTVRCRDVRTAIGDETALRRPLLDATLEAHDAARTISAELSRLKHLLAARRDRLGHESIPGHAAHRDQESDEADLLAGLIAELTRGLC